MTLDEKLLKIFSYGYVCDHCLGRQFAKLLTGFSNDERGMALRRYFAMKLDASGEVPKAAMENFSGIIFRNEKVPKPEKNKPCSVCKGFFDDIDRWVLLALKASKGREFLSFSVGTTLSDELLSREENLWETAGVDYCEPLKAEINREVGKRIEKKLGLKADLNNPQATFLVHLENGKVAFNMNPLFIYGEYQKLVRGIPQTKWPSRMYRTSVEQIIAKPVMKFSGGIGHKLHGLGREDIDARCLGWRPFVLEITNPDRRTLDLKKIQQELSKTKKVNVKSLRISGMKEVRDLKDSRATKQYQVMVFCDRDLQKKELAKLKTLVGEINQRTPERVEHRRADKIRNRGVIAIKSKYISKRKFLLTVTGEAGLYIKELVSGDGGRTKPSVASLLGCGCRPKDLDVMRIIK